MGVPSLSFGRWRLENHAQPGIVKSHPVFLQNADANMARLSFAGRGTFHKKVCARVFHDDFAQAQFSSCRNNLR